MAFQKANQSSHVGCWGNAPRGPRVPWNQDGAVGEGAVKAWETSQTVAWTLKARGAVVFPAVITKLPGGIFSVHVKKKKLNKQREMLFSLLGLWAHVLD